MWQTRSDGRDRVPGQWRRHVPAPGHLRGAAGIFSRRSVTGDFNGDGRLDLAVVDDGGNTVSVLLGNGDGTFQPAGHLRGRGTPVRSVAGDFTGDGRLDLPSRITAVTTVRCCWAMATAPSSPRSPTRSGSDPDGSWQGTSPATAGSTSPSPTQRRHGVGVDGQRRWHFQPRSPTRSGQL